MVHNSKADRRVNGRQAGGRHSLVSFAKRCSEEACSDGKVVNS